MRNCYWLLVFLLLPLVLSVHAQSSAADQAAATKRGLYLYASCKAIVRIAEGTASASDVDKAEYCFGFLDGYTAGTGGVCVLATTGTAARVYVKYMDDHPKLMDEDSRLGFDLAMDANYHCSSKR